MATFRTFVRLAYDLEQTPSTRVLGTRFQIVPFPNSFQAGKQAGDQLFGPQVAILAGTLKRVDPARRLGDLYR